MDNASKALVMAGAILIAVMLISLGVMLFNQGQDIANQSSQGLNTVAINSHNATFEKFLTAGNDTISGTQINSLLAELRTYTYNEELQGTYGPIGVSGMAITDRASSNKRYKVSATYYGSSSSYPGCIQTITITPVSASAAATGT